MSETRLCTVQDCFLSVVLLASDTSLLCIKVSLFACGLQFGDKSDANLEHRYYPISQEIHTRAKSCCSIKSTMRK